MDPLQDPTDRSIQRPLRVSKQRESRGSEGGSGPLARPQCSTLRGLATTLKGVRQPRLRESWIGGIAMRAVAGPSLHDGGAAAFRMDGETAAHVGPDLGRTRWPRVAARAGRIHAPDGIPPARLRVIPVRIVRVFPLGAPTRIADTGNMFPSCEGGSPRQRTTSAMSCEGLVLAIRAAVAGRTP